MNWNKIRPIVASSFVVDLLSFTNLDQPDTFVGRAHYDWFWKWPNFNIFCFKIHFTSQFIAPIAGIIDALLLLLDVLHVFTDIQVQLHLNE